MRIIKDRQGMYRKFYDTFVYTNSFRNQYFSVNESDLRVRKSRTN